MFRRAAGKAGTRPLAVETGGSRPSSPSSLPTRHLVLETEYEIVERSVAVVDCMPIKGGHSTVVRMVEGRKGRPRMQMELIAGFDYGPIAPCVRCLNGILTAIDGPDTLCFRADVDLHQERQTVTAEFTVSAEQRLGFVLVSYASHESPPPQPWKQGKQ